MNRLFLTFITGVGIIGSVQSHQANPGNTNSLTKYVDPMIGTGDHGHVFLGANVPFGLVQLGPSQTVQGWDWCSGYHHSDTTLRGFSHTHLSGTGIGDLGDVLMYPATDPNDHEATFNRKNEIVRPGYYRVILDPSGIEAEMTATQRTGMHRYTFPASADTLYLNVDLIYGIGWDSPKDTEITLENKNTISGHRHSRGWAPSQKLFFTSEFSLPIAGCEIDTTGRGAVAMLKFIPDGRPLTVKTGLSAVSVENAKENLRIENPGWDFDATAAAADNEWNGMLGKAVVKSGNETDKKKFYTSLYHTMTAPAIYSDHNGDYRGADGQVHNTNGTHDVYTIFSLWDTYRAAHPLSTLIHPEIQKDYAGTFLDIFREQGKLPVWHLHGNETDCMVGNPGVTVLADLVMKGFVEDEEAALEAMKVSSMLDERSMRSLKKYGYIPYDSPDSTESVARGMEYAIADEALAKVADRLNHKEDAAYFHKRGQSYREYFDPETRFMRGKSMDGKFRDEVYSPFAASHRADDYCEGNGWQYLWLVPQDPEGLIELLGGKERFIEKLDSLFIVEGELGGEASPDISGLIGQYAHGNEPSHHTIYLYNYAGVPEKAAPLLRKVMREMYTDQPAGLCGNEDVGQMSAWYVLSAMGLYQVEPASGRFVFGSPVFDEVTLNVGDGKTFRIVAHDNSDENIYVQSIRLNGQPWDKPWIDFRDIAAGGLLEFQMSPTPK